MNIGNYNTYLVRERTAIPQVKLDSPPATYELIRDELQLTDFPCEVFYCLYLNAKGFVIGVEQIAKGGLTSCSAAPREVFRGAILANAHTIICAHSHPSGDCSPSPEDISTTKILSESGDLLGIKVLDHIIFSQNNYFSMLEKGMI